MLSISEPFIRRPVATTLLSIGLFLLGIVAYRFLPVASVPNVDFPWSVSIASCPMLTSLSHPLKGPVGG